MIKNAESLQKLHTIRTVVFDKTGTVTNGKPVVTDMRSDDIEKAISLAGSLEQQSEHPLAQSIVTYANAKKVAFEKVT